MIAGDRTGLRMVMLLLALGAVPRAAIGQVIPPGQEELLSTLLRGEAPLPDGCTLAEGQVNPTSVRPTYHCPAGDVVLELLHPDNARAGAIVTRRFAVSVVSGSPSAALVHAIETAIRAHESAFRWEGWNAGKERPSTWPIVLLIGWSTVAGTIVVAGALRRRTQVTLRSLAGPLFVALVVASWLLAGANPPAHGDSAIDVALARDCIASRGTFCVGHAASAAGVLQGQGFTYALALWLFFGLSIRALCLLAALTQGAAAAVLHHAIERRFAHAAWVVSAFIPVLGVSMTGYPTIWNPTWFLLPLAVAFVAVLAMTHGAGAWTAFVAGVALALAAESHALFGTFALAACAIVLVSAPRPAMPVIVLATSFVAAELAISPAASVMNVVALRSWFTSHPPILWTAVTGLLLGPPLLLAVRGRLLHHDAAVREWAAVAVWLLVGAVGLGMILPWAVSRPVQIRYAGMAWPAIAYLAGWALDVGTLRTRSRLLSAAAIAVFAWMFFQRVNPATSNSIWSMDDGMTIARTAGLHDLSALDLQVVVRALPHGAVPDVAAAFVGTAAASDLPPFVVRAVRTSPGHPSAAGWTRTDIAGGELLLSNIAPWTHPEAASICRDPLDGEPCLVLTADDWKEISDGAGGAVNRLFGLRFGRIVTGIHEWTARGATSMIWKVPVRADGPDPTRIIVVDDGAGEEIVGVEGARWTRAERPGRASISRPDGDGAASVVIRTPIAGKFEAGVPPMPFELRADEEGVLSGQPG